MEFGEYSFPGAFFSERELEAFLNENKSYQVLWLEERFAQNIICEKYGYIKGQQGYPQAIIDLKLPLSEILGNFSSSRRSGIKKAENFGVHVELASDVDIEPFRYIWINGYCKKYGINFDDAKKYIEHWVANKMLFLAKRDGVLLAGSVVREIQAYQDLKVLVYSQNSSLPEYLKYNPNEYLIWNIIKYAKEMNFAYLSLAGSNVFKNQFTKSIPIVNKWIKNGVTVE